MGKPKPRKVRSGHRMAKVLAIVMVKHCTSGKAPSKFTYEGWAIAALRRQLCLAGWPWDVADRAARDLVAEALRQARAARPSWAEGQHAAAGNVTKDSVCRQCGVGLRARQVSYCSGKCAAAWNRAFNAAA